MMAYARRWKAGMARLWLMGTLANLSGTERMVENMLWLGLEVGCYNVNVRPWALTYTIREVLN
jgi:hypothetical protein